MAWYNSAIHAVGNVVGPTLKGVGTTYDYLTPGTGSSKMTNVGNAITNPNVTLSNPGALGFGGSSGFTAAPKVLGSENTSPNVAPTGGGGGGGGATGGGTGGATHPALNAAAIANTQKNIDQLGPLLQAALDAEQQKYQNAESGFGAQEQQQRGVYDTGTTTNQQNYDSNFMASLRAGAQGLAGLMSALRGTGVEGWADQAVRDTTNSDIRTGLDTRQENQSALDTTLSSFLTELAGKRNENRQAFENNQYAARGNNAQNLQDLYQKMAGYYADAGNTAEATRYMNMAGDQAPNVARYGVAPVRAYDAAPVNVKAADVSAFAGPSEKAVGYNPGNTDTTGLFTIGDTRKRLAGAGA